MSSFTLPELKRLSEAAMPGPFVHEPCASFCSETAEWMGDTVTAQGEPICYDRDVSLLAYLGTHRDRIVALLEAADALADAVSTLPPACGECQKLFKLSGGTELTTCAHAIGIRQQKIRDAAADYKKAKGA